MNLINDRQKQTINLRLYFVNNSKKIYKFMK